MFTKKSVFYGPIVLLLCISVVGLVDLLLPIDLRVYGLRPRTLNGLVGIFTMPFLHGNIAHFSSNAGPLFMLSIMVSIAETRRFYLVTGSLIFISGLFTWVIASNGYVIGASGLIFAYWAFLIASAWHKRDVKSLFLAAITVIIYGYLIFAFTEVRQGISYAAHFSGFLSGIVVSSLFSKRSK